MGEKGGRVGQVGEGADPGEVRHKRRGEGGLQAEVGGVGLPGRERDLEDVRDVVCEGRGAAEQGGVVGRFEGGVGGMLVERVFKRACEG